MARAPINGTTLTWARTALGVELDELAKHAGVRPEAAAMWESGDTPPTVGQLRAIANKLERTPAFFFAPPPVETGVPAITDFRGRVGEGIPTNVLRETKRAEEYRKTFFELAGPPENQLNLVSFDSADLEAAASALRSQLMRGWPQKRPVSPTESFNVWRELFEQNGILVFQSTRIPMSSYRGLSVFHERYPVILINGADAANGKIFTLFHELGHLANRSSAVCMTLDNSAMETLCNRFAAEVLMPRDLLVSYLRDEDPKNPISGVASRFGVSALAAAIRLHTLGQIDDAAVEDQRAKNDTDWQRARQVMEAKVGNPPPWRLRYRDLGPTYVRTVLSALQANRIDYINAAYMLHARVPMIEQMQQEFHRRGDA